MPGRQQGTSASGEISEVGRGGELPLPLWSRPRCSNTPRRGQGVSMRDSQAQLRAARCVRPGSRRRSAGPHAILAAVLLSALPSGVAASECYFPDGKCTTLRQPPPPVRLGSHASRPAEDASLLDPRPQSRSQPASPDAQDFLSGQAEMQLHIGSGTNITTAGRARRGHLGCF